MISKAQITQILGILGVAYRRQAMTEKDLLVAVPIWHDLLSDLDFDLLRAAVQNHCTSSKWFPSVAELRDAAFELAESDADKITPGEAWAEVKSAIAAGSSAYYSKSRTWSSPLVEKAFCAIGGWDYYRYALSSAEPADRARFIEAFQDLRTRGRQQGRMLPQLQAFREQRHLALKSRKTESASHVPAIINDLSIPEQYRVTAQEHTMPGSPTDSQAGQNQE